MWKSCIGRFCGGEQVDDERAEQYWWRVVFEVKIGKKKKMQKVQLYFFLNK